MSSMQKHGISVQYIRFQLEKLMNIFFTFSRILLDLSGYDKSICNKFNFVRYYLRVYF